MKNKSFLVFLLVFCMSLSLFACNNNDTTSYQTGAAAPDTSKSNGELGIDFISMHNYVIDTISEQYTPFFYIKDGEFDISGDNKKKTIVVKCTCLDGTTVEDLDLFLSLVLQYIGFNAAEQDFRFKAPSIDETGTYMDFGTVFDTYSLEFDTKTESGNVLRKEKINKGNKIPVDPRYWSE